VTLPPSPSRAPLAGRRVAVVGAGFAGLRAATRLQSCGARVTVLEERDRVGGKAVLANADGFASSRSLQVLLAGDAGLLGWIRELRIAQPLLPLRPVHGAQLHRGRVVGCRASSLAAIARTPGVSLRDRARVLRLPRLFARYRPFLDPACPEKAADLDYRSVADFGRLYFGRSLLERFVAPRVAADTLGDENELSRVAFLLHWAANESGRAAAGLPAGALGLVAEAAARSLEVRTSQRALEVKELASGRLAVECSGAGGDEVLDVDGLVVATSPRKAAGLAGSLLVPAERDYFAKVRMGPLVTLCVATSRPPTGLPELVRVPHAERLPIEVVLAEPGLEGGRAPTGCGLVTLSARQDWAERHAGASSERIETELLDALAPIFPSVLRSFRRAVLHRDLEGVPRFEVGAYRALARFAHVQADRRSLGRRLYFAGDYLAGPRFEDAVASGLRAADAVVRDLG
jgi:protoporphyrinogen oxidase